jgi:hypothetical protein
MTYRKKKENTMKRTKGLMAVVVLAALGLIMAGLGDNHDGSAYAEKPAPAMKGVNMKEGKWEITSTVEMKGMPAGMMQPQTHTTCLKQNDYVPKNEQQKDCTMKDMKVIGNTVSWEVVCKDSSGKGRITYAGSTYDGAMEMTMKDGGRDMNMKMTMKGKHIGPCDK